MGLVRPRGFRKFGARSKLHRMSEAKVTTDNRPQARGVVASATNWWLAALESVVVAVSLRAIVAVVAAEPLRGSAKM